MPDAARYIPDTIVVDVDEPRRRPRTGEVVMHVYHDGCWHRRTPDLAHTACALRIDGQRDRLRPETLVGPLCELCFTPFERSQSKGHR